MKLPRVLIRSWIFPSKPTSSTAACLGIPDLWQPHMIHRICNYGHLPLITGYFYGIIHSIHGVFLVLITDKWS